MRNLTAHSFFYTSTPPNFNIFSLISSIYKTKTYFRQDITDFISKMVYNKDDFNLFS